MQKPIENKKFVIIDGHALIHRAYHALPPMTTRNGEIVNAVYGFAMILLKVLKDLDPDYAAVAMDLPAPTFRHTEYAEYKATRQKAADDLIPQFDLVRELIRAFNIPIFEEAGYEADDVIGSLSRQLEKKGDVETFIVTGDLDELQLVDKKTRVYTMRKGFTDTVIYDEQAVFDKYGLTPEEFIIYKALKGDTSDNIPGVTGIGEKTACDLVAKYHTLDGIYANLTELKPAVSKKLEEGKDVAYLSEKLSRIVTDLPLKINFDHATTTNFDRNKVFEILRRFEFKSLLTKIPGEEVDQASLFDETKENPKSREHFTAENYKLINDEAELKKLVEEITKAGLVAIDTETDSVDEVAANLCGISLSIQEGKAFYIPVNHKDDSKQLNLKTVLSILGPVFADKKIQKVGHNIKYDFVVLKNHGFEINGIIFDTMIAAYLINPNARAQSLDELAFTEFGIETLEIEELIGKGKSQISFDHVACDKACLYASEDADITLRLYNHLREEIGKEGFSNLMATMEAPLIPVLGEMELTGVKVDCDKLKNLSEMFQNRILKLEQEIYKIAGSEFNIGSPSQLQKILFDKLQLQEKIEFKKDLKKLPSGGYSTGADALEVLKQAGNPIIELIIEYRELTKLKNTYVDTLPELVNEKTGRIHTNFNQAVVATGRLSSTNPNLQNIPIRTDLGMEIRKSFIADKGCSILSADYSQIELRIMAHYAKDPEMIAAFNENKDFHTATAALVFNVPEAAVTRQMRSAAKAVNFGINYGLSAYGLSRQTEMTPEEAREFIDKYFGVYKGLAQYMKKTVAEAREKGYAETLFGRKRYLPDINSSNFAVRGAAERMALNMPIQGTAADMIKLAMIEIHKDFKETCPEAKMLLQVHDELVFEVPDDSVEKLSKFITEKMENIIKLDVPVLVNVGIGKNWGETK